MIKILRAHNIPPPIEGAKPELFAEVELTDKLEGTHKWNGGTYPVEWTRQQLLNHINANYDKYLRKAMRKTEEEAKRIAEYPIERPELLEATRIVQ